MTENLTQAEKEFTAADDELADILRLTTEALVTFMNTTALIIAKVSENPLTLNLAIGFNGLSLDEQREQLKEKGVNLNALHAGQVNSKLIVTQALILDSIITINPPFFRDFVGRKEMHVKMHDNNTCTKELCTSWHYVEQAFLDILGLNSVDFRYCLRMSNLIHNARLIEFLITETEDMDKP